MGMHYETKSEDLIKLYKEGKLAKGDKFTYLTQKTYNNHMADMSKDKRVLSALLIQLRYYTVWNYN